LLISSLHALSYSGGTHTQQSTLVASTF